MEARTVSSIGHSASRPFFCTCSWPACAAADVGAAQGHWPRGHGGCQPRAPREQPAVASVGPRVAGRRGRRPPDAEQQGRTVTGTKPLMHGLANHRAGGASHRSRVQPSPWSRIEAHGRGSRPRRKGHSLAPPATRATCVPSHGTWRMSATAGMGLRATVHGGPRGALSLHCRAQPQRSGSDGDEDEGQHRRVLLP
jgi:hypothetical protein